MTGSSIPESIDAYEPDDPKNPLWLDRILDRVGFDL